MDELERSLLNVFTNCDMDRMAKRRADNEWLSSLRNAPTAMFVPFFGDRFLLREGSQNEPAFLDANQIKQFRSDIRLDIYLGSREPNYYFVSEIANSESAERLSNATRRFTGLRESGASLKVHDATMMSYAKAMIHWHRAHEFCGTCGSTTQSAFGGHTRNCTNVDCGTKQFPRTDPAIIVAVTRNEKCLFGRQHKWPVGRYSVVAGFVEPGESIEQAVVREVLEETDIRLKRVHYHSSQPWPFPGSIMLGFMATAENSDIRLIDGELQDAHWRSVKEVIDGLHVGNFRLPPKLSIAYRLIEDWFNVYSTEKLTDVLRRYSSGEEW